MSDLGEDPSTRTAGPQTTLAGNWAATWEMGASGIEGCGHYVSRHSV